MPEPPDPEPAREPRSHPDRGRLAGAASGLAIGLLTTTLLAAIDLGAALLEVRDLAWGGSPVVDLIVAAFGEFAWSHGLVVLPLAAAAGAAWPGRPAWALAAGIAVGGGLLAGSLLVEAGHGTSGLAAGVGSALLLAAMVARTLHLPASGPPGRAFAVAVVAAATLVGVASVFFVRSPWFGPGRYRAPQPAPVADAAREPGRPHVLWVVLDTARADRMSLHGYPQPTTPFLAELGRSSAVFDAATADGTWTAPSHASMFTGRTVRAHGVGRTTPALSERFETTASALATAGYRTASFANNPLIDGHTGLARGFQDVRLPTHLRVLGRPSLQRLIDRAGFVPPLPWLDSDQGAALSNDRIARWLAAREPGPVFLFVNYTEAHLPWEVPEAHRRAFLSPEESARSRALRWRVHGDIENALNRRVAREGTDFLDAADAAILRRQYDATLHYLDARVAELVAMFEAAGLWQDTLFIVTSDHGEYLGDHDLWSHLYRTYQDLTHVALLVRPPGGRPGTRSRTPVLLSDLHATVLAATLGRAPAAGEGRNLLAEGGPAPRPVVSEAGPLGAQAALGRKPFRMADSPRGRRLARPEVAIRDERFKLVRPEGGPPELYDLVADPGERHDLLRRRPEVARRLAAALRDFEAREPAHQPSGEELLGPDSPIGKALRALGYVED